jgi:hypothetical protein
MAGSLVANFNGDAGSRGVVDSDGYALPTCGDAMAPTMLIECACRLFRLSTLNVDALPSSHHSTSSPARNALHLLTGVRELQSPTAMPHNHKVGGSGNVNECPLNINTNEASISPRTTSLCHGVCACHTEGGISVGGYASTSAAVVHD